MKCYKGFDKNLKCFGGFQYEIGKTYETDKANICDCGFHACENPMDVLNYFPPSDSRYCEVDLDANDQTHDDSKRVGKRIRIETEIGLSGLISAGVKFILDKVEALSDVGLCLQSETMRCTYSTLKRFALMAIKSNLIHFICCLAGKL